MSRNTDPSRPYLPHWPQFPNELWSGFPLQIDEEITPQENYLPIARQALYPNAKQPSFPVYNARSPFGILDPDDAPFSAYPFATPEGLTGNRGYLLNEYTEPNWPRDPLDPWQTEALPPQPQPQFIPVYNGTIRDPFHYPPTPTAQQEAQQVSEEESEEESSDSDSSFFSSSSDDSSEEEDEEALRRLQTAGLEPQGDPLDWEPF
jgi:hypothetical protein